MLRYPSFGSGYLIFLYQPHALCGYRLLLIIREKAEGAPSAFSPLAKFDPSFLGINTAYP